MASNSALEEAVDLNTQTLVESSTVDDGVRTEKSDTTAPVEPAEGMDGGEERAGVPNGGLEVKEEHLDEKGSETVLERDDGAKALTCSLKKDLEPEIRTDNRELCEAASNVNFHIFGDSDSSDPIMVDSRSKGEVVLSSASGSLLLGDESRVVEAQDYQTPHDENMGADIENLDRTDALQAELVYHVISDENPDEKIPGTSQENDSKDVKVDSYSLVEVPVEHYSLPNEDAGPAHIVVSSLDPAIVGFQESSQEEDENVGACSYNSDEYVEFNSEDSDTAVTGIEYYNRTSGNLIVDLGAPFVVRENYGTVTEDEDTEFEYSETEEMQTVENDIMFTDENRARYPLLQLRESNFSISDLVWGKVRSHPWWPAQIFDPSDASEIALRHKKRDSYLVAYFGDHTFAWNEASRLRPFCTHFTQMEKQSTLAAFLNAVNCALEEISRRVEFGLACYCIPDGVYNRIKAQVIDNAGIREGASVADSAYGSLNMTALEPDTLVQYIKDLAVLPSGGADRLELTVAKGQLLSFYRSKGYPKLPAFSIHRMLSENEEKSKKSKSRDVSSHKRKNNILEDGLGSSKKQRSLADLMDGKISPALENGGKYRKTIQPVATKSGRGRKRKISSLIDVGQIESPPTAKKSLNVGECIRRVASQLTGSSSILKNNQEKSQKGRVKFNRGRDKNISPGSFPETTKEMQRKNLGGRMEYPSPNEMLSQLCLAARDPMKGYSFLSTILRYFSEYRDVLLQDNIRLGKQKKKTGASKTGGEKSSKSESSMETFKFDDVKDSYWTDRIVHNNEGELLKELESVLVKEGDENTSLDTNHELTDEKLEEECSPTALILNFMEADSLPTESVLKNIFSRYGPLKESETEVMRKSKRAKVVFKRQADAEVAFSSAGKFSIFGPALASYRLRYLPSPSKSNHGSTPSSRKDATTMKDCKQTSQLTKKSEMQTAECRDRPPLVEGSNQTSQLSEKDKNEMEQKSQLSTEENSSLILKQTEKDPAEIACRAEMTSIEGHSIKYEFHGNLDIQEAGDGQPPPKDESEKMCVLSEDVNQLEHGGELHSSEGCNQISQLPVNNATRQEGVVELCPIEGSSPTCTPPQNVEVQVECRAEVRTCKISQRPREDVNLIEYGEPCSREGNNQSTEPNNVELQTRNISELACSEDNSDKALELHEKGGSRTESGLGYHYLEGTSEIYQPLALDLNQIECGGKFFTKEWSTQLIEQTKNVEMQKVCVSELPGAEGTHQVSELHKKDGPQIARGPEVSSREGATEISHSLKKDIKQIECGGEFCSQEGHKQLSELPENMEKQAESITDLPCRESGKQVSEQHEKGGSRTESGPGHHYLEGASEIYQPLAMDLNQIECGSKFCTKERSTLLIEQPKNVEMQKVCVSELPGTEGTHQVSELHKKDGPQIAHGPEVISREGASEISHSPKKDINQIECEGEFCSQEGHKQLPELPENMEKQAESIIDLPCRESGKQVSEQHEKGGNRTESGPGHHYLEGTSDIYQPLAMDLNQIECGSKLCTKERSTQLIEQTKNVEMQNACVSELSSTEGTHQVSELHRKDAPQIACGSEVSSREGASEISHSLKKDINQIECWGEFCSQEGHKQLSGLPENMEKRAESITDLPCTESGKQVSELHDKEVNPVEIISESRTLGIGSPMSAVQMKVEIHGENAAKLPPEKGVDKVSQLPGAEQAFMDGSNQMLDVQTESLTQSNSVQAESMTNFVSDGDCLTSELCIKCEGQTKSVPELSSVGGIDQVSLVSANDVQQMVSRSSASCVQIPSEEGRDQMPLVLGKYEISTDRGDEVPVESQGSDTVHGEEAAS
ncbi:uncharacterized protein [Aristolochia californica]|uniref:uncharacterized protein n=1 Tax=Aristolochia californica TaxID=171875 RepID=UPI0035DD0E22